MGCSASRLEHGEAVTGRSGGGEASAAVTVVGIWPIGRGIDEIRRRRSGLKGRKDSIVSTTELLLPEEHDASDAEIPREESVAGKGGSHEREEAETAKSGNDEGDNSDKQEHLVGDGDSHTRDAEPIRSGNCDEDSSEKEDLAGDDQEEKQAEGEHEGGREAAAEGDKDECAEAEETPSPAGFSRWADLPASPSFRIYYVANDSDDDESVKVPWIHKRNKSKGQVLQQKDHHDIIKEEEPNEEKSNERADYINNINTLNENALKLTPELEQKQEMKVVEKEIKSDRGRRLRSLWKAPSMVYSFLNVRNCYHQNAAAGIAGDGHR